MFARILNVFLLSVLYLLTVSVGNAQIASTELNPTIGDHQMSFKQKTISLEEEFEERIEKGDLLNPEGASAYDIYQTYPEKDPIDQSLKRKLKRSLVAALVEASDVALMEYFDEGGVFVSDYLSTSKSRNRTIPIDQYYFVAAELLGEDNYLYQNLKSKGHFIEALKFQYIDKKEPETVKQKLNESIALDPGVSYTYYELGLIYFEEENYQLACENYNQAIQLNSYWETPKEKLKIAEEALKGSKKNN